MLETLTAIHGSGGPVLCPCLLAPRDQATSDCALSEGFGSVWILPARQGRGMVFLNSCQCWHLNCVVTHGCSFSIASSPPATFPQARPPRAWAPLVLGPCKAGPHLGTCVPAAPFARNAPVPIMHTCCCLAFRSEVRGQSSDRLVGPCLQGQARKPGWVESVGTESLKLGPAECTVSPGQEVGGRRAVGRSWRRETAAWFCRPQECCCGWLAQCQ